LILRQNAIKLLGLDTDPVFGRYERLQARTPSGDCC
jgi:hypothetical protein